MKLANVEMIPAVVVDDNDPMFLGRVKVSAPGEFDVDTMNIDDMFWIYPFPVGGYQAFSHMLKGTKVWLLKNTENYYEYWYLPYFEMNANTFKLVNSKSRYDADVLVSRSNGANDIQAYYNNEDGFVHKIGFAAINIMTDGTISITSGGSEASEAEFHVNSKTNNIGFDGEERQPAALGKNTSHFISDIQTLLMNLATTCGSNPYTAHLVKPLNDGANTISKYLPDNKEDVQAKHVNIN